MYLEALHWEVSASLAVISFLSVLKLSAKPPRA